MTNNNNYALEQKLMKTDFYNETADKDGMYSNFISKLNNSECSKEKSRRKILRPAMIMAIVTAFAATMGLTAFADNIEEFLNSFSFTGGTVKQVDELVGQDKNVVAVYNTGEENYSSYEPDVANDAAIVSGKRKFTSYEQANSFLDFDIIEPVELPEPWELKVINGFEHNNVISAKMIEISYSNKNQKLEDKVYSKDDELPRFGKFAVYQSFIGEGETLNIDTVANIQTVTINGTEMALIGNDPTNPNEASSLTWVKDGIEITICPDSCTYEELIEFAEAFTK